LTAETWLANYPGNRLGNPSGDPDSDGAGSGRRIGGHEITVNPWGRWIGGHKVTVDLLEGGSVVTVDQ